MKEAVKKFDEYLKQKNLSFEAIIIGGAALRLMGVISRVTHDVDFLDPEIPTEIKNASVEFAKLNPDLNLRASEWINNGPRSLTRDLPIGWRSDLQLIFQGEAMILHTLGRINLLRTKLYALADRGTDFQDCVALAPSLSELEECKDWVLAGDASELWPGRVRDIYSLLIKELKLE